MCFATNLRDTFSSGAQQFRLSNNEQKKNMYIQSTTFWFYPPRTCQTSKTTFLCIRSATQLQTKRRKNIRRKFCRLLGITRDKAHTMRDLIYGPAAESKRGKIGRPYLPTLSTPQHLLVQQHAKHDNDTRDNTRTSAPYTARLPPLPRKLAISVASNPACDRAVASPPAFLSLSPQR